MFKGGYSAFLKGLHKLAVACWSPSKQSVDETTLSWIWFASGVKLTAAHLPLTAINGNKCVIYLTHKDTAPQAGKPAGFH